MGPEHMRHGFSIGELAGRARCRVETVRYYEREGLMPDPPRSRGGHRVYDSDHMKRLSFIRRARELGFTLDQVRSLLGLADTGDYTCADVKSATLSHREDIRGRIADLERLDAALTGLAKACDGNPGQDCAIFGALFDDRK